MIDLIRERRAADPAMHVYHYAAYEVTALKRLTCEYGTREEELDDLLRGEVFVDLYKVVSQGLRLSHERYGLKQVETFYFERDADLRAGDDSIVLYEDWLERHDPQILDDIAAYNEEDCVSTLQLRDWLLPLRPGEAPARRAEGAARAARGRGGDRGAARGAARRPARRSARHRRGRPAALAARAAAALPPARGRSRSGGRSSTGSAARARSCRSATPRRSAGSSRRAADRLGAVARLAVHVPGAAASPRARRATVFDPATGGPAGKIEALDEEAGTLSLRRGPKLDDVPLPAALIPGGAVPTRGSSRRRCGGSPARCSPATSAYRASKSILVREPFRGAAAAGRPRGGEGARRRARRQSPRHPGAARVGQDLHRRAADRPPDAASAGGSA